MVSRFRARWLENWMAVVGGGVVFIFVMVALFAPFLAPHSPTETGLSSPLMPPVWMDGGSWKYLLGTDELGRDILSRLIYGARISLVIGLVSVGIALGIGVFLGCLAGYYGGILDYILGMVVDILLSLPAILLAIVIVAILGPSLTNAIIAIGIVRVPVYIRLVRASVLQEKRREYVMASRLCGASNFRLMFVVILPNCMGPVIVQSTMGFASAILEAAGLSFLSLGAQPPSPEWGAMLRNTLQYLSSAPWVAIFPGLAIFFTVTGFNLMGDGLMDILDPKRERRLGR
ncbi:MAG: ABC transporter permease subunit [Planctomycetota bacterium]|nr:MAG: ABC transporter permease subunit [Planctomycetota bacterium]